MSRERDCFAAPPRASFAGRTPAAPPAPPGPRKNSARSPTATHPPTGQVLANRLQPPSAAHWFGTDAFGRDLYSRVVWGGRLTVKAILMALGIAGPLGVE